MMTVSDLPVSTALDYAAMSELKGRGCDDWQLLSLSYSVSSWSNYQQMFSSYVGIGFHDGYLSRQTYEGWKRTRVQTEYSYWYHWQCV